MRSASSGDRQGKKYQPLRHCRAGAVLVWIPHPIEGVRRIKIYDAILCTELHFKIYSASDSARGGASLAGSSYLSQNQAGSKGWRLNVALKRPVVLRNLQAELHFACKSHPLNSSGPPP